MGRVRIGVEWGRVQFLEPACTFCTKTITKFLFYVSLLIFFSFYIYMDI